MDYSQLAARQIRFTVLGPLSLIRDSKAVIFESSKPVALLASLLLQANTVVPVQYLQRTIWGDEPPEAAKGALQTCVLRLRRLFGSYGIAGSAIETLPDGYRILAEARTLDLIEFRELLSKAYASDDSEVELDLIRQALALWRPAVLGNVNSALLHRDEVPRLTEEWLRAVERVFDIELSFGRCREVLAEILSTAHSHPVHERFWEQLIEALYRTGRRAEALAECRRVKEHLQHELGMDPGPPLQRLELTILRGEPLKSGIGKRLLHIAPREPEGRDQYESPGFMPSSGAVILDRLFHAGLLEEGPEGHYEMNELLRVFTRAAASGQRRPESRGALRVQAKGTR
jgi:SARP family transcriptional regulator, regulator of embCAB operon